MPSPISKALTAPMETKALARLASSFSKTGSPRPVVRPVTWHSTIPPAESISVIHCLRNASAFRLRASLGIPVGVCPRREGSKPSSGRRTGPKARVKVVKEMPSLFRSRMATAPAATLPMVSLPEERPPPR